MSPTHTNKAGVRFRYYTSYALQQKRASEAGNVSRVPAPEIEQAVITALREQLGKAVGGENAEISEKGLIERHLERIVVSPDKIQITLASHQNGFAEGTQRDQKADDQTAILNLPWTNRFSDVKGIVHAPIERASISPEQRDTLLLAIAKARAWLEELVQGRADSFAVIAKRESRVERHIRLLAPLAFVSPALVQAINLDSAPGQLTVTGLAQRLPHSWRKQQERLALS
jgi:hypothetical protein